VFSFPPTPPNPPIRGPEDEWNKEFYVNYTNWHSEVTEKYTFGQGKLISVSFENGKIILVVDTDKGEAGLIETQILPSNEGIFTVLAERNLENLLFVFRTQDPWIAYKAIENYFQIGDPIIFFASNDPNFKIFDSRYYVVTWR